MEGSVTDGTTPFILKKGKSVRRPYRREKRIEAIWMDSCLYRTILYCGCGCSDDEGQGNGYIGEGGGGGLAR